jgi:hypothetical protein
MSGVIPPLPLMPSWREQVQLHIYLSPKAYKIFHLVYVCVCVCVCVCARARVALRGYTFMCGPVQLVLTTYPISS